MNRCRLLSLAALALCLSFHGDAAAQAALYPEAGMGIRTGGPSEPPVWEREPAPPADEAHGEVAGIAEMAGIGPFTATWWRHGFALTVGTDGLATVWWRAYRWCDEPGEGPCDTMENNHIEPGGAATAAFTSLGDEASAPAPSLLGHITASNDARRLPLGPVHLTLLPDGMVRLSDTHGSNIDLCGPHFDAAPQAVQEALPCGA
jgi:hypothetical protein